LHAGDGDLFVAGIDQTDKLIGGLADIADALNGGGGDYQLGHGCLLQD
jgi:hypothetical protein